MAGSYMVRTEPTGIFEDGPDAKARPFRYEALKPFEKGKRVVFLGKSDILVGAVQVLREGGENNLHAHSTMDGFWMVLSGRVRFYGEGDVLLGDFGKYEGILVPRNCKYWFESVGSEPAELLQVEALTFGKKLDRIDYSPPKAGQASHQMRPT